MALSVSKRWNRCSDRSNRRAVRQFLLRGVEKVRAEWAMICTTHNFLKLFAPRKRRMSLPPCNKCQVAMPIWTGS